ncbi:MAG: EAL domain-containing protein [Dehalococcoidia bacterium]
MGWLRLSSTATASFDERRRAAKPVLASLVSISALALSLAVARADEPAPVARSAEYHADTGTLQIDVTGAVTPAGVQLEIDGAPVATSGMSVAAVGGAGGSAGTVVVAIEASSSTAGALLASERDVARELINALPEGVAVGLVSIGDSARELMAPTTDHAATIAALEGITTGSGAAIYDGVAQASTMAAAGGAPRSIVVLTYGWHFGSNRVSREASQQAAQSSGAAVHSFAFGTDYDAPYLTSLAGSAGSFSTQPSAATAAALGARLGATVSRLSLRVPLSEGTHAVNVLGSSGPALSFSVARVPGVRPAAQTTPAEVPDSPSSVPAAEVEARGWGVLPFALGILVVTVAVGYVIHRVRGRAPAYVTRADSMPSYDPGPPPPVLPDGPGGLPLPDPQSARPIAAVADPPTQPAAATAAWPPAPAAAAASTVESVAASGITSVERIARGLKRLQLAVRYQPVFDNQTGELVGAEALLLADAEGAASMTTRSVLRMATAQGPIAEITELVVGDACRVVAELREAGASPFRMSVNISAEQLLDRSFLSIVKRGLSEARIDAAQLELEVPEHSLLDSPRAIAALTEASRLGVGLVVDDYWATDADLPARLPSRWR